MGPTPRMVRETAVVAELNKVAGEYRHANGVFETARQNREAAKEKFGAVRRLAQEVLLGLPWHTWQLENMDLLLIGADLGDAVTNILESRAYEAADAVCTTPGKTEADYDPSMTSREITALLDERGYEFKGAAPGREVHAALLRLKGVEKVGVRHAERFVTARADEIYKWVKESYEIATET